MVKLPASLEHELGHVADLTSTQGFPFDLSETTPELQWPNSVRVYDQMRRQDAQIKGVLRALTLPLLRAPWHIDPAGAKPDVAQRIADDLGLPLLGQKQMPPIRLKDRFSWTEHLQLALLSLPDGHMAFEQVYAIGDDGLARLAKLSPRMPRTIHRILVDPDGSLTGIEQLGLGIAGSPSLIPIPADRLVWYSNEREGGNWQGQSILRSVYKNWLLKDRLLRVQAMTIERNGMGIPVVEASQGATPQQVNEANQAAEMSRAGEYSGVTLPYGFKLTYQGVNGTLPDAQPAIAYHDSQIAKNVLAQFLELGSSAHGSRALGSAFIDFFALALEAVAAQIASVVNEHVIEDLVDINWGPDEPAPRLIPAAATAGVDLSPESLALLVQYGAVEADDDLEAYIRERYKLPARNPAQAEHPLPSAPQPVAADGPAPGVAASASASRHRVHAAKRTGKVWATATTRRNALYARLQTRQKAAIASLAAQVDVGALVDQVMSGGPGQVMAAAGDGAADAVNAALTGAAASNPAVRQATADSLREGQAEGATAAKALVAQARGTVQVDFEIEFEQQLAALSDLDTLLAEADPWVVKQLQALSHDVGANLAKQLTSGASRKQMIDTVAAGFGSPQGAWLFLDNAIATSLSAGAVDLYTSEGVGQVDFLTTEDDRVDEDCQDAQDANPWAIEDCPQPPLHLNCRCVLSVSLDGG